LCARAISLDFARDANLLQRTGEAPAGWSRKSYAQTLRPGNCRKRRVLTLVFSLFLNHWTYASAAFERLVPVVMLTAAFDIATCRFRGWKTPGNDSSGNSPWRGESVLRVEWVLHATVKLVKTTVDFFSKWYPKDVHIHLFIPHSVQGAHVLARFAMSSWGQSCTGRWGRATSDDPRGCGRETTAVARGHLGSRMSLFR